MAADRQQITCPQCGSGFWILGDDSTATECPHCGISMAVGNINGEIVFLADITDAVSLEDISVPDEVLQLVPETVAREFCVFPVRRVDHELVLAVCERTKLDEADKLRFIINQNIQFVRTDEKGMSAAIESFYGDT